MENATSPETNPNIVKTHRFSQKKQKVTYNNANIHTKKSMSAKNTSRVPSSRVWLFYFFLSTLLSFLPHRNSFSLVFKLPAAASCYHKLHRSSRFLPSPLSYLIPNSTTTSLFALIPSHTQLSHPMNQSVNISWVLKVGYEEVIHGDQASLKLPKAWI